MSTLVTNTIAGLTTATSVTMPTTTKIGATAIVSASAGSATIIAEGGTVVTNIQQGLAKSWINFEGDGTIAVSDSLNVTSITDRATGQYTITIANDMANAVFAVSSCGSHDAGSYNGNGNISHDTGLTAGTCPMDFLNNSAASTDIENACTTIHGDLA